MIHLIQLIQIITALLLTAVIGIVMMIIFEIKKIKIDTTTNLIIPAEDYFYVLIKDLTLNDKEFRKFTLDNYKILICYDKEKDSFYLESYD